MARATIQSASSITIGLRMEEGRSALWKIDWGAVMNINAVYRRTTSSPTRMLPHEKLARLTFSTPANTKSRPAPATATKASMGM
jgi:hypothetical protein